MLKSVNYITLFLNFNVIMGGYIAMFILILLLMITVFSIATYVVMCIELKRLYDLIKIMSEKQIELLKNLK